MEYKPKILNAEMRSTNFEEVNQGFDRETMLLEANRCLSCLHEPCRKACPVNVPIKEFIEAIKKQDLEAASNIIKKENVFPSICGRVCPQEHQCQGSCVRSRMDKSVQIGLLERYVGDFSQSHFSKTPSNGIKIGVIGSGPASLSCAYELGIHGYEVTVFEALHEFGGVLTYGIPEFRLPKSIVKREIQQLQELGVIFEKNCIIGKTLLLEDLRRLGYQAFFIGSGAGTPNGLNVEGELLNNVYYANGFLTRINLMKAYQFPRYATPFVIGEQVAVIGGGNVAMDAARVAKRLGAKEVSIIYRRDEQSLPARKEEIEHAHEEGIQFRYLLNPIKIIGTTNVEKLLLEKMKIVSVDKGKSLIQGSGELEEMDCDMVIMAIGQRANAMFFEGHDIVRHESGTIKVNDHFQTSIEDLYAGGDIINGGSTVIRALGEGKNAAKMMMKRTFIKKK